MDTIAKAKIEMYGRLCEDSLKQAIETDEQHDSKGAEAFRACAELWSAKAFKEARP